MRGFGKELLVFGAGYLNEKLFKSYAKQTCKKLRFELKIINNHRTNLNPVLALILKILLLQNLFYLLICKTSFMHKKTPQPMARFILLENTRKLGAQNKNNGQKSV